MKEHKAILDIETGGFSISKNGICEIGMLIVDESLNVVKEINQLIKPYLRECGTELVSYKDDALKVNGITIEDLETDGIDVKEAVFKVSNAIINHNVTSIIGHNIKFDVDRVDYLLKRFLDISIQHIKQECTLDMSRRKLNLPDNSLESVCKHFRTENIDSHRALSDCYATLEIYKKLI